MRVMGLAAIVLGLSVSGAQAQTAPAVVNIDRGDGTVTRASRMSGHAGSALASGNSAEAAMLAEQALEKDGFNAWAHYRRAAALSDLKRTDEAVAEYKVAEEAFNGVDDRGKSLALYGRAFTLSEAGRCGEAKPVYEQYARLVEKKDPKGAAQARSYAQACRPPSAEESPPATPAAP